LEAFLHQQTEQHGFNSFVEGIITAEDGKVKLAYKFVFTKADFTDCASDPLELLAKELLESSAGWKARGATSALSATAARPHAARCECTSCSAAAAPAEAAAPGGE
jgi:hypothetical protein